MNVTLPIRGKIALWCAALTGATVVVFAIGTLINVYQEQMEAADLELIEEARHVELLFAAGISAPESIERTWSADSGEPWVSFAAFDTDGRLHRATASLPEEVIRGALPPGPPRTVRHDGAAWRVQAFALGSATGVVTFDLQEVHDIVQDLLMAYLLALPLAAFVTGLGGWWLAGRALAPMRELTNAAAAIGPDNLGQRVPVPATRDEIARLATVLNEMLARLERSLRQAERFAADASHELRTPLTIIGGEIEALLRHGSLGEASEARLVSVQEEIGRLGRIVENLLLIARLDAGGPAAPFETVVDFSKVAAETCDDAQILAAARHVSLETSLQPGLVMRGDPDLLHRLVFNLLDNATKFNVPGGTVRCTLQARGTTLELSVENTGPGIPAELRPHIFERFFRADAARSVGGHGLGLALCREIARTHGGEIHLVSSQPDTRTLFRCALPQCEPGSPRA
jgi:two-component system, OmpR family, heavy metal sensor histidine kinase CusS